MSSEKQTWRLFSASHFTSPSEIILDSDEHHYAIHVLRLGVGDTVELGNSTGQTAVAEFIRADKKTATLRLNSVENHTQPRARVHVFLGMPKPATLEEVAALVSELGASSLHVFRSARTQFKNDPKLEKLQRQSREALRINKGAFATEVFCYNSFSELAAIPLLQRGQQGAEPVGENVEKRTVHFLCDESPLYSPDKSSVHNHLLGALQNHLKTSPGTTDVGIFVGPEASFSEAERSQILALTRATPVTLGARILRVPTAVSAAVSLALGALEVKN